MHVRYARSTTMDGREGQISALPVNRQCASRPSDGDNCLIVGESVELIFVWCVLHLLMYLN